MRFWTPTLAVSSPTSCPFSSSSRAQVLCLWRAYGSILRQKRQVHWRTRGKIRVDPLCYRSDQRLDHGGWGPASLDGVFRGRSIWLGVGGRQVIQRGPSFLWSVYDSYRSGRRNDYVRTGEQAHRHHAVFAGGERCFASSDTRPHAEVDQ